jgi:hypothetical protein
VSRGLLRIVRIAAVIVAVAVGGVVVLRIAITQPSIGSDDPRIEPRADAVRLEAHVRFLTEDVFPRSFRRPGNLDATADYVRRAFEATAGRVTEQRYEVEGGTYRNVLLRLGPAAGQRIVVGAHYDVAGLLPGADDNASGVAGLLELARLLDGLELASPVELAAYSTEEPPFFGSPGMGSAVHASSLAGDRTPVRAMISLEMIGYFSKHQPAPFRILRLLYPATGDFILVAGRWRDRPLIREVKRAMRGVDGLRACSYCGPTAIGTDLSDHRNFWAEGYPAVMITDTAFVRNPNYHTAADTADTLDYRRMARVVDGVANAVAWMQARP